MRKVVIVVEDVGKHEVDDSLIGNSFFHTEEEAVENAKERYK